MGERRHPHDSYGKTSEEELAARREGSSLRAKYYRWKDRILPPRVWTELRDRIKAGDRLDTSDKIPWIPAEIARQGLENDEDGEVAYRTACETLMGIRNSLIIHGLGLPPWEDPPEP